MEIIKMRVITFKGTEDFLEELTNTVDEFQKEKLIIEIQYSLSDYYHSALVIGRVQQGVIGL